MARPKKEGMEYFPHDTDAVNDEKIEAMRALYGNDGYAFFFILLERIYRSGTGMLDVSSFTVRTVLINKLGIDQERFETMLNASFEVGLFDRETYEMHQCITSFGIKKRQNEVDEARTKWRGKKSKNQENEVFQGENGNKPEVFPGENSSNKGFSPEKGAQRKVKESKGKESSKTYTSDFLEFWNQYPRKIGKLESFKTWNSVIKAKADPALIIKCAGNYAKECDAKNTELQFIKHPKTFLNQERYLDYETITLGGGNGGKHEGRSEALQSGGNTAASEFAFLDENNPRWFGGG